MPDAEDDFDLPENAEARGLEKAAEVLEDFLIAADGGDGFVVDQFAATAILAMLDDPAYYAKVKAANAAAREEEESEET